MPARSSSVSSVPRTYAELRRGVEEVVFAGRARIEAAWLRTYHETGRLIHEHLLLNRDRADYGTKIFNRLATDTGISKRVLYECVQLVRCFPIVRTSAQLTRSHYILLCQVSDEKQRAQLTEHAIKHDWTVHELTSRVRAVNAAIGPEDAGADSSASPAPGPAIRLLTPKRGTPGLHLVTERGGELAIDRGFKLYHPLSADQARRYAKGDIVRLADDGSVQRSSTSTKADLFTYAASVRRIVDGDTLVIAIRVAVGVWLEEKLRLRDLDCPEMSMSEGRAAKRFTEGCVPPGTAVVVSTTKPDKYDRYLADVFVDPSTGATTEPENNTDSPGVTGAVYLNNALLESGHAVRKSGWEPADWE